MYSIVYVETRNDPKYRELLDRQLIEGWEVIVYCSLTNRHLFHDYKTRLTAVFGPNDYNNLLASRAFWDGLNYERVLITQHDTEIFKPEMIEDFLEWDYVGAPWEESAPWARKDRKGGNGGLSLRNPKAHLEVLKHNQYHPNKGNEDVFFSHLIENVAPYEVCKKFSVETVYEVGTFGAHAIDKYHSKEKCDEIRNYYITV